MHISDLELNHAAERELNPGPCMCNRSRATRTVSKNRDKA